MDYFTTDDGVRLAYSDRGSGQAVVFISGYSVSASTWFLQEEALLGAGYRVILFDRRSHGASDNPAYGQTMLRQGQDIGCLMEHLNLDHAVLVGQSQGASSIFSYISQYGTSRLAAVVDIDQTPKMINDESWPYGMRGLTVETRPTFFDKPLGKANNKPLPFKILVKVVLSAIKKPFDMKGTKPLLLDHADANWLPVLPKIDVPALFIAGEKSPFWPPEHARAAAQLCQKGSFTVIPESGHAVNWEFPDRVNQVLLEFLSSQV